MAQLGTAEQSRPAMSRGNIRMSFEGTWDPLSLESAMADSDLSMSKSKGPVSRWTKPAGTTEGYPLIVDTKVDDEKQIVLLRGYVLSDNGTTKLTLDGDDGVSRHAKSGALDDFENVCDRLRDNLRRRDRTQSAADDMDSSDTTAVTEPEPVQQVVPSVTQQSVPQPAPMTRDPGYGWQQQPASQQWQGTPSYQQPAPGSQYGMPQPVQTQQMVPSQPSQAPQQFGYGATQLPQQRTPQGVAPGWVVQSVPNKCWMFIAISCIELILLMAESAYFLLFLPLFSWPAIPAIVQSVAYKNAFQAGNAQLALMKMKSAKGWIIGAGVWCAIRVLLHLAFCS